MDDDVFHVVVRPSIQTAAAPARQRRRGDGGIRAGTRFSASSTCTDRSSQGPVFSPMLPGFQIGPRQCTCPSTGCRPTARRRACHPRASPGTSPALRQRSRYGLQGFRVNSHNRPPGSSSRAHSSSNSPSPSSWTCWMIRVPTASVASGSGKAQRRGPAKPSPARCRHSPRPRDANSAAVASAHPATGASHSQGWAGRDATSEAMTGCSASSSGNPAAVPNHDRASG